MSKKHMVHFLFFMLAMTAMQKVTARTVGSNSLVARQKEAYFRDDESNSLLGFSVFEGGVVFENSVTNCSIDVFFPLSGPLVLNGGTLQLKKDLVFQSPFYLGSGIINADSYAIEFPHNVSTVQIPCANHKDTLTLLDQIDGITDINSVDWSFDSKYVAIGIDGTNSGDELRIYYFDGEALTYTASYNFSRHTVYSVRWHPSAHYLAVGKTSSNELNIFQLDVSNGALNLTDSANINTTFAVAWHPNGTHLAVGQYRTSNLLIYPISHGSLGSPSSVSTGSSCAISRNALSWNSDGNYLAAGLYKRSGSELLVYSFDGSDLTLNASVELGQSVYAVAWRPNSAQLAAGIASGSDRLRLYDHDSGEGSLTEVTTARVNEARSIYGLAWNPEGTLLAESRASDSNGFDVKVFSYDTDLKSLNITTGYDTRQTTESISWSPNGQYVASGDRNDKLNVYGLRDTALTFKDAKLFFGSDVVFTTTVRFEGNCIINASSNILDLSDGMLVVGDDAHVQIEHTTVKGIQSNNIHCTNDDAVLSLRDVCLIFDNDMTFSTGSMLMKNHVVFTGEGIFAYQSSRTSTIAAKSELELDNDITFSYDPIVVATKNFFAFEDETSVMALNGATLLTTATGMDLSKGTLHIKRDSYLTAETEEKEDHTVNVGFTMGDNVSGSNDFKVDIFGGETLYFTHGKINYKNVSAASLNFGSMNSSLYMYPATRLNLYQSLSLNPGFLTLGAQTVIARASGKEIIGSVRPIGRYFLIGLRT